MSWHEQWRHAERPCRESDIGDQIEDSHHRECGPIATQLPDVRDEAAPCEIHFLLYHPTSIPASDLTFTLTHLPFAPQSAPLVGMPHIFGAANV
jgi:hypothetical protein